MRHCLLVLLLSWCLNTYALTDQVCFTPGENCTALLVKTIHQSQQSILVQAYSFTSMPIADALVDAKKRGVDVKVILDRSQVKDRHSVYGYLLNGNIPVWIDHRVPIAHSKVMIMDANRIETGSFNYSKNALRNSENLLILNDPALAKQYTANWYKRLSVSKSSSDYV